jgi:hypothetical protein
LIVLQHALLPCTSYSCLRPSAACPALQARQLTQHLLYMNSCRRHTYLLHAGTRPPPRPLQLLLGWPCLPLVPSQLLSTCTPWQSRHAIQLLLPTKSSA